MNESKSAFMRKGMALILFLLPIISFGQIDCPAFGRMQSYERFEVLLTWNTVDPYPDFDGLDLQNDTYLFGEYKNTSIAPGITLNFYPDNSTIIRLKGIYTDRNITQEYPSFDTLGATTNVKATLGQTLIKVAPGFGWVYFVQRFSFYGGFEIPFTYQSDFAIDEQGIDTSVTPNNVTYNATTNIPQGYSIGLGTFAGSTFYFPTLFGIGFEVAAAYQYTELGGTIETKGLTTDNPPVEFSSLYFDRRKVWKFSPVQASMHVSIRF